MKILIDVLISIFLVALGYVAVCYYFNQKKWNSKDVISLKFSKNKIIYLAGTVIATIVMIVVLNAVYELELLSQVKLLTLVLMIFPISAVDYRVQKIPNQFIVTALALRLLIYVVEIIVSPKRAGITFIDNLLGAFIISLFFLLLLVIFKNSVGMGDVKLFFVMGMYQGLWGVVNSVFFSLFVSFVLSVGLLITKKKQKTDTISFGPSILLGTIIGICLSGM